MMALTRRHTGGDEQSGDRGSCNNITDRFENILETKVLRGVHYHRKGSEADDDAKDTTPGGVDKIYNSPEVSRPPQKSTKMHFKQQQNKQCPQRDTAGGSSDTTVHCVPSDTHKGLKKDDRNGTSPLLEVNNSNSSKKIMGQDTTVISELTIAHTGARDTSEVTTDGAQQHTRQLSVSTQENHTKSIHNHQVTVEQEDNHQSQHDAAPSSTATSDTSHGESGCKVREETGKYSEAQAAEKQKTVEESETTVQTASNSAWPNADIINTGLKQDILNHNNKTTGTESHVVKNTTQNQYRTESVYDDQADMTEFERDSRDTASNSCAATGSGSGSNTTGSNTIFKFGSGSNATRSDNTERHKAAAAELADAERFVKSHTTPAQHSIEQRMATAVESLDTEKFVNFQEQHNYPTATPSRQSNSTEDRTQPVERESARMFKMWHFVNNVAMTFRSLDVDARIVEWQVRTQKAKLKSDREKYRASQLAKCVTRHATNILKSRIYRWYDQKEATLQSDREKYLVSQLVKCVAHQEVTY